MRASANRNSLSLLLALVTERVSCLQDFSVMTMRFSQERSEFRDKLDLRGEAPAIRF